MFHVTNLEYSCRGFFSTRYIKNTITVTQLAQRKKKIWSNSPQYQLMSTKIAMPRRNVFQAYKKEELDLQ